jgi:hypothetical protein
LDGAGCGWLQSRRKRCIVCGSLPLWHLGTAHKHKHKHKHKQLQLCTGAPLRYAALARLLDIGVMALQCSCLDQPSRGFGAFSTFYILYEFYSSQLSVRNLSQDCSSCCVHAACYDSLQLVHIYSLQETYAGSFFPLHITNLQSCCKCYLHHAFLLMMC